MGEGIWGSDSGSADPGKIFRIRIRQMIRILWIRICTLALTLPPILLTCVSRYGPTATIIQLLQHPQFLAASSLSIFTSSIKTGFPLSLFLSLSLVLFLSFS